MYLGEVNNEYYPGLSCFADFMRTYSECAEYPVYCTIARSTTPFSRLTEFHPLDFEIGETGSVFVNTFGLSIVFYSSIAIYESAIIGSHLRGYHLVFHYTLVNGPDVVPYQPVPRVLVHDYTRTHFVSHVSN